MAPRRSAPAPEPALPVEGDYPMALYKRNSKKASGYDVRRAADAADEAQLVAQGWKNSPEEV